MNEIATNPASKLEDTLINGDLKSLEPDERVQYFNSVCKSVGLNPITRPFEYIVLNGKLQLYAKRDAAEQLRKIHGVSIKVLSREEVDGLYIVTVAALDRTGRSDEDIGAVTIAGLRGENRANAIAKATTKAKRRVTLSLCGLGILDETEVDDIKNKEGTVSYDLDEWFGDKEKSEDSEAPESATEEVLQVVSPEKVEPSESALKYSTDDLVLLYLDDANKSPIIQTSTKEWYTSYINELKVICEDENFKPRDRMSRLKKLEELNAQGLSLIPEAGREKLLGERKKFNAKLGAIK